MRVQRRWWSGLVAAVLGGLVGVTAVAAAGEQFLPRLGVREGALRAQQIPLANGFIDYVTLLNVRDGGINGVPLVWEECETVWDVSRGVACYERLKGQGPTGAAAFAPANVSEASDGRVFPYVFTAPTTFWSQNTAKIRFMGQRMGGMEQLKGRKIVHVYHDSDLGRETLPMLDAQAAHYGFTVQHLAVPPPGLDQKATWLRVKVAQPDWVILRSVGVMTTTALKEAAQIGFPRDKIVGASPTCAE
jgi:branched-chain amino acid transport system substrate-binding protein